MRVDFPRVFDDRIYTKSEKCNVVKMDECYLCSKEDNKLVFKVSETAGAILKLLDGKSLSQHQISQYLKENFNCNNIDEQDIEKDVSDIMNEFERYGLIVASTK